jgi:hypothetical protein
MLYGHSVGLSDFALLLAVAFWTWLWGGVGLVLATPLTVCIVVYCKHAPSLEWVDIVMGDNPTPQPHLSYYQNHLAGNEDAAQALLEGSMRSDGLDTTLEDIALPALALTRHEEVLGKLDHEEAQRLYQSMRTAVSLLKEETEIGTASAQKEDAPEPMPRLQQVYGRALDGEPDAQALEMLGLLLPSPLEMRICSEPRLVGELVHEIEEKKPAVVCISAMPLRAQFNARTLCRRMHAKLPELKILVCRWGLPGQDHDDKPLREAGATWVVATLKEARDVLARLSEGL